MKRNKIAKSKMATIMMFVFLALFLILFIVFFNVADGFKSSYSVLKVELAGNATSLVDKLRIRSEMSHLNQQYELFAVLSYVFSILSIAALGIGLALTDKFKTLEEKAAENA